MEHSEELSTVRRWLGTGSVNFFGRPYAGKDSQADEFVEHLGGVKIGAGDIFRTTESTSQIMGQMNAGMLVDSSAFVQKVLPYLSRAEYAHIPLFLSALGRKKGEEQDVVNALEASGHPLKAVILLNTPEDESRRRFSTHQALKDRGERDDDDERVLENRLHEFKMLTLPVLDYYRDSGSLIEIDATLPRHEVTKAILSALAKRALNS